ncbi:hypothetical protein BC962_1569 [Gillisia mitskevichiae]|uniref:Sensor of ECF-type sigma factor n=1 Tax=Gillisia mitskevichiae TaxID=270921 RepID=A0A495PX36_9FLAO|nr:hypothetical protein [Gillisia mitskevichiae]RKS53319.1 hypothetical protein BC962_1569 [Gillisia mitskevichiae]
MKKVTLILILFISFFGLQAQDNKDREQHRERIKAMKVAFITQEMSMTPELAQKFWPIYNKYECQKMDLHRREHEELNDIESLSEKEAEKMLMEYQEIENEEYQIKKSLFTDLKKIISSKEIIKLHKLESDFNKKLLKEYRERKAKEQRKN